MAKPFNPQLLSPMEFWAHFIKGSIYFAPREEIPKTSRGLLILEEVFGRLFRNCTAKINKNQIDIQFHGCHYATDQYLPACEAHLGAIVGVFERATKKSLTISKTIRKAVCHARLKENER